MRELRGEPEPGLAELLARLTPVDLVLVEGFKREAHPKIEVWRGDTGKPMLKPDEPQIIAMARDAAIDVLPVPLPGTGHVAGISAFFCTSLADRQTVE